MYILPPSNTSFICGAHQAYGIQMIIKTNVIIKAARTYNTISVWYSRCCCFLRISVSSLIWYRWLKYESIISVRQAVLIWPTFERHPWDLFYWQIWFNTRTVQFSSAASGPYDYVLTQLYMQSSVLLHACSCTTNKPDQSAISLSYFHCSLTVIPRHLFQFNSSLIQKPVN